jgi:tetratricopeptide (TPR) repeat protein
VPEPGALWLRWEGPAGWRAEGEEAERRSEAEALFRELLALPPERRSSALKRARFRRPALVELLLEKSRETQLEDPEKAEALALTAASLTVQLQPPGGDGALVAIFMARAHCLAGNARRLMGSEADAEIAFANTAYFLARSGGSCDRAFYCRSLAVLRWEQGRIDEAAALLFHAARIFAENGAVSEEGTALGLAGLLYLEEGDLERALGPFRKSRLMMDVAVRPWLSVRVRLGLALSLADIGYLGRSRWMRQEAWNLYSLIQDPEEQYRSHWMEGRICGRLGALEEGIDLLTTVRGRFLDEARLPETALVTLDLALLLTEARRSAGISSLVEEVESRLGPEDGSDIALRGLRGFQEDLAQGKSPRDCAAGIASFLRRTFRFRGFRVEPIPFA